MCQIVNVVDLIYFSKDIYPATGAKRDMQVYTTKPNTTPTCTFDTKQNQLLKPKANNSDNSLIVGRKKLCNNGRHVLVTGYLNQPQNTKFNFH